MFYGFIHSKNKFEHLPVLRYLPLLDVFVEMLLRLEKMPLSLGMPGGFQERPIGLYKAQHWVVHSTKS
jgi:hypothetical protein